MEVVPFTQLQSAGATKYDGIVVNSDMTRITATDSAINRVPDKSYISDDGETTWVANDSVEGVLAGNSGETATTHCPSGTYSTTGSLKCQTCPKGKFSTTGASVCIDCKTGTSTLTHGTVGTKQSVCNVCFSGKYNSSSSGSIICTGVPAACSDIKVRDPSMSSR